MKRHQWMVFAPFEISVEDGLRFIGELPMQGADLPPTQVPAGETPTLDDERPWLGLHNLRTDMMQVACYECEQRLDPASAMAAYMSSSMSRTARRIRVRRCSRLRSSYRFHHKNTAAMARIPSVTRASVIDRLLRIVDALTVDLLD